MKKTIYTALLLGAALLTACGGDDEPTQKDLVKPTISGTGIEANPIDCQVYKRGGVIPFNYVFGDNVELGTYNIEVHNNFDHHTHGTSVTRCEQEPDKDATKAAWVFNKTYDIPTHSTNFVARHDIAIPATIDTGDYHFMIRVTDKAGNQEIKGIAIKIVE